MSKLEHFIQKRHMPLVISVSCVLCGFPGLSLSSAKLGAAADLIMLL